MSLLSRVLCKGARHAGRVALRVSPVTKSTARNAVIAASAAGAAIASLGYTSASPALAEVRPRSSRACVCRAEAWMLPLLTTGPPSRPSVRALHVHAAVESAYR